MVEDPSHTLVVGFKVCPVWHFWHLFVRLSQNGLSWGHGEHYFDSGFQLGLFGGHIDIIESFGWVTGVIFSHFNVTGFNCKPCKHSTAQKFLDAS